MGASTISGNAASAHVQPLTRKAIPQQGGTWRMRTAIVAALGFAVVGSIAALAQTQSGPTGTPAAVVRNAAVDASSNIRVPANYRATYEFLGSWSVAADQGAGAKQLHIVYASPGAVAAYRKSGISRTALCWSRRFTRRRRDL